MQAQEPTTHQKKTAEKTFKILFYLHLLLITILIFFLTIRGLISISHTHHFHPIHWYPPLLSSTACAAIAAFGWLAAARRNPSSTLKATFWLSPLLTFGAGVLLLIIGSAGALAAAAIAIIFALIQSIYACWVVPRFDYAARILSVSLSSPSAGATNLILVSITVGTVYSCFSVTGIGGATATSSRLDAIFISVILLSFAWTMHVIRNISHVAISRVGYMYFAHGMEVDTRVAFHDTIKHSLGRVCIGSAMVPVLGVVRGSARAMGLIAGDTDEFMFSCANCYAGVATRVFAYGHRWGFVHVGVYDKGFVRASVDTWEMFGRVGMESLIDSDITGSFCFLCGVAVGAMCTIVGGSWALVVDKDYATEVSIYAFLIGYFTSRITMSWPQACVSGYYVAYAEKPQSLQFDATIPKRIQELQRSQA
ncbi:hypothetical protein HHK36_019478 [Tetracentron sinense]|uniref:Choline transporter-like protein n=1 Tax=Tetracentron sinense TaxID=13715 RepID=A0A834YXF8_TETSI|nr:hypothetical protein HHK36_019478 [Tetracentron sinense]